MCDYTDFKSYENRSANLNTHITVDTLFASLRVISAENNSDPNSDIGSFYGPASPPPQLHWVASSQRMIVLAAERDEQSRTK